MLASTRRNCRGGATVRWRSMTAQQGGCVFCNLPTERIIASNAAALAIRDDYPVTQMHTLVIPKRHTATFFDLFEPERRGINQLLDALRIDIRKKDTSVGLRILHLLNTAAIERRACETAGPPACLRALVKPPHAPRPHARKALTFAFTVRKERGRKGDEMDDPFANFESRSLRCRRQHLDRLDQLTSWATITRTRAWLFLEDLC